MDKIVKKIPGLALFGLIVKILRIFNVYGSTFYISKNQKKEICVSNYEVNIFMDYFIANISCLVSEYYIKKLE